MYYSPAPSPGAMHIPDGFLSVLVSVVLWTVSILVVAYALKRASSDLGERQVPLMGVLAAAIFAGQMLNFAVAGGTSGHLMGAGHNFIGALGGCAGDDHGCFCPGADLPGWRPAGVRGEYI